MLAGYQVVDADSGRYLGRDAPELRARGWHIAGVAGAARHRADALGSDAIAPGRPLELRRDADNAHDANAIAVHASAGGEQVGWVPGSSPRSWLPTSTRGVRGRPWSCASSGHRRTTPGRA